MPCSKRLDNLDQHCISCWIIYPCEPAPTLVRSLRARLRRQPLRHLPQGQVLRRGHRPRPKAQLLVLHRWQDHPYGRRQQQRPLQGLQGGLRRHGVQLVRQGLVVPGRNRGGANCEVHQVRNRVEHNRHRHDLQQVHRWGAASQCWQNLGQATGWTTALGVGGRARCVTHSSSKWVFFTCFCVCPQYGVLLPPHALTHAWQDVVPLILSLAIQNQRTQKIKIYPL